MIWNFDLLENNTVGGSQTYDCFVEMRFPLQLGQVMNTFILSVVNPFLVTVVLGLFNLNIVERWLDLVCQLAERKGSRSRITEQVSTAHVWHFFMSVSFHITHEALWRLVLYKRGVCVKWVKCIYPITSSRITLFQLPYHCCGLWPCVSSFTHNVWLVASGSWNLLNQWYKWNSVFSFPCCHVRVECGIVKLGQNDCVCGAGHNPLFKYCD